MKIENLFPELRDRLADPAFSPERIENGRRGILAELAEYIYDRIAKRGEARLTFICTHNSRRSQLGQVWAQTAAAIHAVPGVVAYSGGTEATSFDRRAIAALERAGFRLELSGDDTSNPRFLVRYSFNHPAITTFSKLSSDSPNPSSSFAAIMTCSQAEQACPIVSGSEARFAVPFDDPKQFDDTPRETEMYDERCRQIGREMLCAFSLAAQRRQSR